VSRRSGRGLRNAARDVFGSGYFFFCHGGVAETPENYCPQVPGAVAPSGCVSVGVKSIEVDSGGITREGGCLESAGGH
jgi:hypothetical protein